MSINYSIDTSSIIKADEDVQKIILKLIGEGRLELVEAVWEELDEKDYEIPAWIKAYKGDVLYKDSNELFLKANEIVVKYPGLDSGRKLCADPFVIALAALEKAEGGEWVVISEEKPGTAPKKPSQIPDVCREMDIECINLDDLKKRHP